jgi:S1-C subfamily serine protease
MRLFQFKSFLALMLYALSGFCVNLNSLLEDERNTVQIFQKAAPNVVYVHRLTAVNKHSSQKAYISEGTGSGIIWDNKGHIVTNYHVIHGAQNLAITIGKKTLPVKVIGAEPRKDIAVLEIKTNDLNMLKDFHPFKIVHLNDLIVGQKAVAIGNPFGLDHSLSKGVISALGRRVPGIGGVTINNMIQTDTTINPGNSGGPLLNSKGELIGLNTMIFSRSGSSAGIGFAVPADDIERITGQIISKGRVVLSGIGIQRVEPNLAQKLGVYRGVLVGEVLPGTPASQAHLRGTYRDGFGRLHAGDVIVGINGHRLKNYDALYHLLSKIGVGETINVTIKREGKPIDVRMKTIDIAAL